MVTSLRPISWLLWYQGSRGSQCQGPRAGKSRPCVRRSRKLNKKTLKSPIVQGHSRSLMLTPFISSSLWLVMITSMSVPICNYFDTRRANNSKITTFKGYPSLKSAGAGLLEHRGSRLKLLKFTFNAENFVCRLSWSISSHFNAIQC